MTTTRLAIAALLVAAALTACPPKAPLPDNTALLIINNVQPSGNCYETNTSYTWRGFDVLCQREIFEVSMKGPKDIGFGPERLGKTEVISPGESRTFVIDLSGNASGDWAIRMRSAFWDSGILRAVTSNLTLEDVQPGDVYNWNWGASN